MKTRHPQYKLKANDTIESLTQHFQVRQEVWLEYHNNKCRIDELIIDNKIPKQLTAIYLLPELWCKELELNTVNSEVHPLFNKEKPIILFNTDILFFAPYNIYNRYGVLMEFDKNKIHYEIEVKYIMPLSLEQYRVSINRTQIYINDQEPNMKLYQMADMMTKSVYPIVLDINSNKKIEAIANYEDIKKRSAEMQKKISQYYVGQQADKYSKLFESHVSNPNTLIRNIENELFYQLFFLPLQGKYDKNLQRKIQYEHCSNNNKKTIYNLNVQLKEKYTESGKIVAKIYSDEKIEDQEYFQAEYRFYPEDHSIFSMRGNLIILDDKNKKNNTYFEIYHINTEERVLKRDILNNKQSAILNEYNNKDSEPPKKKKSFWDIFK